MTRALRWSGALLALALLTSCGSEEQATAEPVEPDRADVQSVETGPDASPETDPADGAGESPDRAVDEGAAQSGGSLTAMTLSGGTHVTMTAPEGWRLFRVDEALADFDILTATRGGVDAPLQTVVVSDQQLGLDAHGVYETALSVHESSPENYSEITVLDPITVDGIEFIGFEALVHLPSGDARIQNWYGDADDTVLGIYLHHGVGSESIPDDVIAIRDSLIVD